MNFRDEISKAYESEKEKRKEAERIETEKAMVQEKKTFKKAFGVNPDNVTERYSEKDGVKLGLRWGDYGKYWLVFDHCPHCKEIVPANSQVHFNRRATMLWQIGEILDDFVPSYTHHCENKPEETEAHPANDALERIALALEEFVGRN